MTKKKKYPCPTHTHVIEVYPYFPFPSLGQFVTKEGKLAVLEQMTLKGGPTGLCLQEDSGHWRGAEGMLVRTCAHFRTRQGNPGP